MLIHSQIGTNLRDRGAKTLDGLMRGIQTRRGLSASGELYVAI